MKSLSRRKFLIGAGVGAAALTGGMLTWRHFASRESGDGLAYASAVELASMIRQGRLTSAELVRLYLTRIEEIDRRGGLNAFISVNAEAALQEAARLDSLARAGRFAGPLHGLPIALKDDLDALGFATTAGSRALKDWKPGADAHAVARLRAAGAIILGKTNLSEFTMGLTSRNTAFGATRNPHRMRLSPGGSSGGSASAVAAGLCAAALGSDASGSIVLPSSSCGVVGLRPTIGRVGRSGLLPVVPPKDVIGPITRCVEDASLILEAIAGSDPGDEATRLIEPYQPPAFQEDGIRGKRFALLVEFGDDAPEQVQKLMSKALAAIREREGLVEEVRFPFLPLILDAGETINFHHFARLIEEVIAPRAGTTVHALLPLLDPSNQRYYAHWKAIAAEDYRQALEEDRGRIRRLAAQVFDSHDFLVTPSTISPAIEPDSAEDYASDEAVLKRRRINRVYRRNAELAGLLGAPSLSLPIGISDGVPAGLQLIGRPGAERELLAAARTLEREGFAFAKPSFSKA